MAGTKTRITEQESFFSPTFFTQIVSFRRFSALRLLVGFLSPCLLGFAAGLSIPLGLGTFSVSVLLEGLLKTFAIPLWVSNLFMITLFYCLAWGIGRVRLGVGTIPTFLLLSPAIELGAASVPERIEGFRSVLVLFCALCLSGLGILLTAAANLGPEHVAALAIAFERRFSWPVSFSVFGILLSIVAIGFLLGGTIMLATALSLMTPPLFIAVGLKKTRALLGVDGAD